LSKVTVEVPGNYFVNWQLCRRTNRLPTQLKYNLTILLSISLIVKTHKNKRDDVQLLCWQQKNKEFDLLAQWVRSGNGFMWEVEQKRWQRWHRMYLLRLGWILVYNAGNFWLLSEWFQMTYKQQGIYY